MNRKTLKTVNGYDFESIIGHKVNAIHECAQKRPIYLNSKAVLNISLYADPSGNDIWILVLFHIAEHDDVQLEEAREVGELLYSRWYAIDFCPFCGQAFELSNAVSVISASV